MRVEIPAYTSLWMRGCRYGEVVKEKMLERGQWSAYGVKGPTKVYYVKLDRKTRPDRPVWMIAEDCKVID